MCSQGGCCRGTWGTPHELESLPLELVDIIWVLVVGCGGRHCQLEPPWTHRGRAIPNRTVLHVQGSPFFHEFWIFSKYLQIMHNVVPMSLKCHPNSIKVLLKYRPNIVHILSKYSQNIYRASKKIDLLYLFNTSGTKKQISKLFFSSENWDPYVHFEYRTISVWY